MIYCPLIKDYHSQLTKVGNLIQFSRVIRKKMSEQGLEIADKRSKSTRGRKRQLKKIAQQKENGFVLDCLNREKSKLQTYNSVSDKFLNYFVIRVHPNRKSAKKVSQEISQTSKLEVQEKQNHDRFQEMLRRQKIKIMKKNDNHGTVSSTGIHCENEKGAILLGEIEKSIRFKDRQQTISERPEEDKSFM